MTSSQAATKALQILVPQTRSPGVVVFALGRPLKAGETVSAFSLRLGRKVRPPTLRLHRRAWLFWEDLVHGAMFAHPSVVLVLDVATGKVLEQANINMFR
jgi:hypothetical protein